MYVSICMARRIYTPRIIIIFMIFDLFLFMRAEHFFYYYYLNFLSIQGSQYMQINADKISDAWSVIFPSMIQGHHTKTLLQILFRWIVNFLFLFHIDHKLCLIWDDFNVTLINQIIQTEEIERESKEEKRKKNRLPWDKREAQNITLVICNAIKWRG